MQKFVGGQEVKVVKTEALEGNEIAPPLVLGEKRTIRKIVLDKAGNQHLDVGVPSDVSFVRSFETKEELPDGDIIWWCHPSRFELVEKVG